MTIVRLSSGKAGRIVPTWHLRVCNALWWLADRCRWLYSPLHAYVAIVHAGRAYRWVPLATDEAAD